MTTTIDIDKLFADITALLGAPPPVSGSAPVDRPVDDPLAILFEPVYQPMVRPADYYRRSVMEKLIAKGWAVDLAGSRLFRAACAPCDEVRDRLGVWTDGLMTPHTIVSGSTCVYEVVCPVCSSTTGMQCTEVRNGKTATRFGSHGERQAVAAADQEARGAAGDLTVPAPWLPDALATGLPTPRRSRPKLGASFVTVTGAGNAAWAKYAAWREQRGHLAWNADRTVATIKTSTRVEARWTAHLLQRDYGFDPGSLVVDPDAGPALTDESNRWLKLDAEHVMATWDEADGPEILAWAAAVKARIPAHLLASTADLAVKNLDISYFGGAGGTGASWNFDRSKFWAKRYEHETLGITEEVTLKWGPILKVAKGRVPQELQVRLRELLDGRAERTVFDSVEYDRFTDAIDDVVCDIWAALRPV